MLTGDMLRRSAARFPNKPAIIDDDREISYRDLDRDANRLANALIAAGIRKGEKVAILSSNRLEYGVAFFGVARSGAILVNVSILYAEEELRYVLHRSDCVAVLYESPFGGKLESVLPELRDIRLTIALDNQLGPIPQALSFKDLLGSVTDEEPEMGLRDSDPFCMTYTGGTTGRPKGVLASHRNRDITAHTVMQEEQLDERDVIGIVTPMFHVAALNIMFQPAILAGATTTLLRKWDVDDFIEMVERTGMTAAFMVPTQIAMVVQHKGLRAESLQKSWRTVSFAGAPMPDWVQRKMTQKLPAVSLVQIYGQSEIGVVTALRPWDLERKLGSIGRQAYNVDLAVVDPQGKPVAVGEVGEVVSWGDNVMLEYYNEPDQTREFFKHQNGIGWTGDLATMDEEGFITLVDRSKDMIISGGENIYPKEIENVLYEHPAVAECAVFGIPDAKWGEIPAAYICLKPDQRVTVEELDAHCASRLARFKRPRLIEFVDGFPKTPIGKIQKNLLRDPFWQEREKKI